MTKEAYADHLAEHASPSPPVSWSHAARRRSEAAGGLRLVGGSEGDDLAVFSPEDADAEIARLFLDSPKAAAASPTTSARSRRGTGRGRLHCVTMGRRSASARSLFEDDRYADYLYLHGFGVSAEAGRALAPSDAGGDRDRRDDP